MFTAERKGHLVQDKKPRKFGQDKIESCLAAGLRDISGNMHTFYKYSLDAYLMALWAQKIRGILMEPGILMERGILMEPGILMLMWSFQAKDLREPRGHQKLPLGSTLPQHSAHYGIGRAIPRRNSMGGICPRSLADF